MLDGYGFSEVDDGAVKISRLGQIGVSANKSGVTYNEHKKIEDTVRAMGLIIED